MAEGDRDAGEARSRAQEAIYSLLIDSIRRDTYPSATMMDIVEAHLTEEELPDYLDILLQKVDSERAPSMDMIRRILALS